VHQEEVEHPMKVLAVEVLNVSINLKDNDLHLQQMNQHHLTKVVMLGLLKQELVVLVVEVDHDVVILKEVMAVAEVVDVETSIIEKVHNKKIVDGNKILSKYNEELSKRRS
jgi:hypothetical protein